MTKLGCSTLPGLLPGLFVTVVHVYFKTGFGFSQVENRPLPEEAGFAPHSPHACHCFGLASDQRCTWI
jgi:hypothetical protein